MDCILGLVYQISICAIIPKTGLVVPPWPTNHDKLTGSDHLPVTDQTPCLPALLGGCDPCLSITLSPIYGVHMAAAVQLLW